MANYTVSVSNYSVHDDSPIMYFTGTIKLTRETEQTKKITIKVSGTLHLANTGKESYGTPYSGQGMSFSANSTSDLHGNYYGITVSGKSVSEEWDLEWTSGNLIVYANCRFGSSSDTSKHCSSGYDNTVISTIAISNLPYNPHSAPTSYSITSVSPKIGTPGETEMTMVYKISTDGTHSISATYARITDTDDNTKADININKTSTGSSLSGTFTLSSSLSNETQYRVYLMFKDTYDSTKYVSSNYITIYTYRVPSISSLTLSPSSFSGFGNSTMSWSTNQRRWSTTYESNFSTALKLSSSGSNTYLTDDISQKPTGYLESNTKTSISQSLTEDIITDRLTTSNLNSITSSNGSISTTFTIKRTNVSSTKTSTTTKTATIQFAPKYTPSSMSFYKSTSSSTKGTQISAGSTIYHSDTPYVLVTWVYNTSDDRRSYRWIYSNNI